VAGFLASLVLRLGGGMSIEGADGLMGLGARIPYPELFSGLLPGSPADWYDPIGATTFPVRTLAAVSGLILIPVVSRLTARLAPPRPLRKADN
jgi:hypothetical protein